MDRLRRMSSGMSVSDTQEGRITFSDVTWETRTESLDQVEEIAPVDVGVGVENVGSVPDIVGKPNIISSLEIDQQKPQNEDTVANRITEDGVESGADSGLSIVNRVKLTKVVTYDMSNANRDSLNIGRVAEATHSKTPDGTQESLTITGKDGTIEYIIEHDTEGGRTVSIVSHTKKLGMRDEVNKISVKLDGDGEVVPDSLAFKDSGEVYHGRYIPEDVPDYVTSSQTCLQLFNREQDGLPVTVDLGSFFRGVIDPLAASMKNITIAQPADGRRYQGGNQSTSSVVGASKQGTPASPTDSPTSGGGVATKQRSGFFGRNRK